MTEPAPRRVRPRHAASLILWREGPTGIEVLMGRRHARHRFMPEVWVFPGGRVDRADHRARVLEDLPDPTRAALERRAPPGLARAIAVAAARELEEETGLRLGQMDRGRLAPRLGGLAYLCRAVTPAASPIRFDARFLIAPEAATEGSLAGSGELEALAFLPLPAARATRLAGITAKVLMEFEAWHAMPAAAREARALVCFRGNDTRLPER